MYATILAACLDGIDARPVRVETDIGRGLPGLHMVGLPDLAVREARERVRSALRNSGLPWPTQRTVINLAPASMRKQGPLLDVPMALALLAAQGAVPAAALTDGMAVGELALNGTVRPVRGAMNVAMLAAERGCRWLLLPPGNLAEVLPLAGKIRLVPAASLQEAVEWLRGGPAPVHEPGSSRASADPVPDLRDVRGHARAIRALTVMAAGGHNLLFTGPPGTGKSMLASRLPGILPPLTHEEALEAMRIASAAGLAPDHLSLVPPYRAPHHSISPVALMGGGAVSRPGEVTLAHNGVLFLDELGEFPAAVLNMLRQPLEEGRVLLSRNRWRLELPARFQFIAARNPCPCGYRHSRQRICSCTPAQWLAYERKIGGALLDRIDLLVRVPHQDPEQLLRQPPGPESATIREQVIRARETALARQGIRNAWLHGEALRKHAGEAVALALELGPQLAGTRMSARGMDRLLRVTRTVADLEEASHIRDIHLLEALAYLTPEGSPAPVT